MGKIWDAIKDSVKQTVEEQKAKFNKDENGLEVKDNNDDDLFQGDNIVDLEQDNNGYWNEPSTPSSPAPTAPSTPSTPAPSTPVPTPTPTPEPTPDPKEAVGGMNNVSMKDMINNISDSADIKTDFLNSEGVSLVPEGMNIPELSIDTRKDIAGTDTAKTNKNDKTSYHVEDKDDDLPDIKLDLSKVQLPSLLMPKDLLTDEQKKANNAFLVEGVKNNPYAKPAPTEAKEDEKGNIGMYFHKGDEPKPIDKEEVKKAEEFLGKEKVDALNESAREALDKGKITYTDENGQTVTKDFNIDKQLDAIKKGGEVDANFDLTQKGKHERAKNVGNMLRKVLAAIDEEEIKKYINDPEKRKEVLAANQKFVKEIHDLEDKLINGEITDEEWGEGIREISENIDKNAALAEATDLFNKAHNERAQEELDKRLAEVQAKNAELKEAYEKGLIDFEEYQKKQEEFNDISVEYLKYEDYIKDGNTRDNPIFEEAESLKKNEANEKENRDYQVIQTLKAIGKYDEVFGKNGEEYFKNGEESYVDTALEVAQEWLNEHPNDDKAPSGAVKLNPVETITKAQESYQKAKDLSLLKTDEINKKFDELKNAIDNHEIGKMSMAEMDSVTAPKEPEYLPEPTLEDVKADLGISDDVKVDIFSTPTGDTKDLELTMTTITNMNDGFATDVEIEQFQKVLTTKPQELLDNPEVRKDINASLDYVNAKYDEIKAKYDAAKKAGGVLTKKEQKEYDYWKYTSAELNQQVGATAADAAYVAAMGQDKNDYKDKNLLQKGKEWIDDKRLAHREKELMELAYKATGDSVNANPAMLSKMTDTQLAILSTPVGTKQTIDAIVESPEMYEGAKVGFHTAKEVIKELGQGLFGTDSVGETLFDLTMTGQRVFDRKQYAEAIDALFDGDIDLYNKLTDDVISEYEVQSGDKGDYGTMENIRYYMEQADANVGAPGKAKNITKIVTGAITFLGGAFIPGISTGATVMNNGLKAMINGANQLLTSYEDKLDENVKSLGTNIGDLNDIITKPEQVEQVKQTIQGGISPESFDILGSMFDPEQIQEQERTEGTTNTIVDETQQFNPGEGLTKVEEEELRKGFNRGLKEKTTEVVSDMDVKKFIRVNYKSDPLLKMIDWRK